MRVLQGFPEGGSRTNPYLTQLLRALRQVDGVEVQGFGWRVALFGRYDVLHLHWPELLCRGRTPLRAAVRRLLTRALLLRLAITRTALVRTIHNDQPHEPGSRAEQRILRRIDRRTAGWITLNAATERPADARESSGVSVIPHGHYREWFREVPIVSAQPGRLVFAGAIRRYKAVDALLRVFADVTDPALELQVIGNAQPPALADEIAALAAADPRVTLRLGYANDTALATAIMGAELIVLPYARMLNSGALILALSLGRPVLVPANELNAALAAEVGDGWIVQYQPPLDPQGLVNALEIVRRGGRSAAPDLSAREWPRQAAAHVAAYRQAIGSA
ncbi:MAG TPA: glycosyltransferase [Candidatus Lumbricidophila sp.]|nr:glycosyltransferase [Candidatus Lumbricidophila sp.]